MDGPHDPDFDLHAWFSEEELKECRFCGKRAAVPIEGGPSVCLSCELVWLDEKATRDNANDLDSGPNR
jgi:hypothetical protein